MTGTLCHLDGSPTGDGACDDCRCPTPDQIDIMDVLDSIPGD